MLYEVITDDKDDYKIFGHVLNGLRDLSLHNFRYKNSIKVTPDNLGRIYFPDDCLRFLSVGVALRGKYWTFSRDKAIVKTSDKTYFQETYDTDRITSYNVCYTKLLRSISFDLVFLF